MSLFSRFKKARTPKVPQSEHWLFADSAGGVGAKRAISCIFFFSYTNMNCIRAFDFMSGLRLRYPTVKFIGVQVPEYGFEKEEGYVRAALEKYHLSMPTLLDHDFEACKAFEVRGLPHFFVLGTDGSVVFDHAGEGAFSEIETHIQQEVLRAGGKGLPLIPPENSVGGGMCYRTTEDLSLGYVHGAFVAQESLVPHEEQAYTQPKESQKEGVVVLQGHWRVEQEYIEHTREVAVWSEFVSVVYSGFSVNIVVESLRHDAEICIELDGRPVSEDLFGEDVVRSSDGRSKVKIDFPRTYRIIDADTYHKGELKIYVKQADIRLYGIFFGGCRNM